MKKSQLRQIIKEEIQKSLNEDLLNGLNKEDYQQLDIENQNDIKKAYYGVGDHLYNLKDEYFNASVDNKNFEEEYEIVANILELFNKLTVGKYL